MGGACSQMDQLANTLGEVNVQMKKLNELDPLVDKILENTKVLGDLTDKVNSHAADVNKNLQEVSKPIQELAKLKSGGPIAGLKKLF